jgi:hypothetical protein
MKQPVKERIEKLREELAQVRVANSLYLQEGEKLVGAGDQRRRFQRLREIFRELASLTDWKEPCTLRDHENRDR